MTTVTIAIPEVLIVLATIFIVGKFIKFVLDMIPVA
jgi:hypothetical protein